MSRARLTIRLTVLSVLIAVVVILGMALSRIMAFRVAEVTMRPYAGISEYAYTKFRLFGHLKHVGPIWLFVYDSPDMFDAAIFTVQVDVFGHLCGVQAPQTGLWDQETMTWIRTPTK